jgi:hypothetical protein
MGENKLNLSGSGEIQMAGFCECGNGHLVSKKFCEFID